MTDPNAQPFQPPAAPPAAPPYAGGAYPAPAAPEAQNVYAPPSGAYGVPVGGYQVPQGGYVAPEAPVKGSAGLGIVALVLGIVALVVPPVLALVFGIQFGERLPEFVDNPEYGAGGDLSSLAPVRDQVLWLEIAFWIGTIAGIAAIVIGIIAIAKRRGRGLGIFGLILAVLGPVAYFILLAIGLVIGATAAAASYGSFPS
jgi:hypothetical protein